MVPYITDEYKKELENLLNEQLNIEMFAAYFYMSCYQFVTRSDKNYQYMGVFFKNQYLEEIGHAQGVIDYMNSLGYKVNFRKIQIPGTEYSNLQEVFKKSYEYETLSYKNILKIYNKAEKAADRSTCVFLDAYVEEQIRSEKEFKGLLADAIACQKDPFKYLLLDRSFRKVLRDKGIGLDELKKDF